MRPDMGIKPVDDMMKKMGISEEDLDSISNEMLSAFGGAEDAEGLTPWRSSPRMMRAAQPPSPSE